MNMGVSQGSPVLETPVTFLAGSGNDTIDINGPASGGGTIIVTGTNVSGQAAVVGAGLQLLYTDTTGTLGLAVNTGTSNDTVDVLSTAFHTLVETGTGKSTVNLGGFGYTAGGVRLTSQTAPIPSGEVGDVAAASATLVTAIPNASSSGATITLSSPPGTLAGFGGPISVAGGSGTSTLVIDDSQDTSYRSPMLTASGLTGLGTTPDSSNVPFTGITDLVAYLGSAGSQTEVEGTATASQSTTLNLGSSQSSVMVEASSSPLILVGGGTGEDATFDASAVTVPIADASLTQYVSQGTSDPFAAEAGDALLTGFGASIGNVFFNGFQQANLDLGQVKNTLNINEDVLGLLVNTDQPLAALASTTYAGRQHDQHQPDRQFQRQGPDQRRDGTERRGPDNGRLARVRGV